MFTFSDTGHCQNEIIIYLAKTLLALSAGYTAKDKNKKTQYLQNFRQLGSYTHYTILDNLPKKNWSM